MSGPSYLDCLVDTRLGITLKHEPNPLGLKGEPNSVVVVDTCDPRSALAASGLRDGDMVLEWGGKVPFRVSTIHDWLEGFSEGDSAALYTRPYRNRGDPSDDSVSRARFTTFACHMSKDEAPIPPSSPTSVASQEHPAQGEAVSLTAPHLDTGLTQKEVRSLTEDWAKVLQQKMIDKKASSLKKLVRRGTPSMLRGEVWLTLSGAKELMKSHQMGYYSATLRKRVPTSVITIIEKDLLRTYPNHPHFKQGNEGLRRLKRVLFAYAAFDEDVRYVQGMSFICATLLSYVNEEEAFWLLVQMMSEFGFHNVLKQGFPLVMFLLTKLEENMQKSVPKLLQKIFDQHLNLNIFVSWFCTLFSNELEFQVFTRLWDGFWMYGWPFIINFILVVFKDREKSLLKMDESGEFIASINSMPKLLEGRKLEDILGKAFDVKVQLQWEQWDILNRRGRGSTMYGMA